LEAYDTESVGLGTWIIVRRKAAIRVTTPANTKADSVPYLVTRNPAKMGAGRLINWVKIPVIPIVED
tara:strand:+ start:170 stop:370 length:201 start_codon:yes stop_codon:yes gene_type:complete